MSRSIACSWRRHVAALLLASSIAPASVQAAETATVPVLTAQLSQYANRTRMIQIALVAIAAGIALLYKK